MNAKKRERMQTGREMNGKRPRDYTGKVCQRREERMRGATKTEEWKWSVHDTT